MYEQFAFWLQHHPRPHGFQVFTDMECPYGHRLKDHLLLVDGGVRCRCRTNGQECGALLYVCRADFRPLLPSLTSSGAPVLVFTVAVTYEELHAIDVGRLSVWDTLSMLGAHFTSPLAHATNIAPLATPT